MSTQPTAAGSADLKYGVSLYSYTNEYGVTLTLEDCIEDVADLGATGIEILGEAHIPGYPGPKAEWVDSWFMALERYRLEPTCYGSWVDTRRFAGRSLTEDEAVNQLETDLRLAARLGFRFLRPKLGVVTSDLEPDPVWEPATERVLDLAAELDVVICPEIHWPSVIKSKVVDDYLGFIDRTGTEHFGLLMDTGVFQTSMHRRGGGVASRLGDGSARPPITPVVPVSDLEDVIDKVVHIQAKFYEIDDELVDRHIPWREILDVLDRHQWSGYLSSEYEGDYATGRAADQLRRQHALLRLLAAEKQS
ncbi:sugar phosphate isomerase/epimerase [Sinomonas atrocyanea]|uniref:sugar phosphate isomerase/epimerase family protein n=1 Tax=Sinomonas atrocyanea TaxID=37927 RepID=UPI00277D7F63|nr:TIM barrel protein [Sinomonas atrocyanea]MDP9884552.1 sugar phosphate isomerase/epimerase [Sinomonas atrocyanea]